VDLGVYIRVLWRFRVLVLVGFLLAFVLAFLSYARPALKGGSIGIVYRQHEEWQSQAVLFVTQARFPEGRSTQEYQPADPAKGLPAVPVGDPGRLSSLAVLYSQFANSDRVHSLISREGPIEGSIVAAPYTPPDAPVGTALPLISIAATSDSPARAVNLARRGSGAFIEFIKNQQIAASIPVKDRVVLEVLKQPEHATLVAERKKTLPVMVFLAVMVAAVGLAFVLENVQPRIREVGEESERPAVAAKASRRSA
jgi:hypothetical protein